MRVVLIKDFGVRGHEVHLSIREFRHMLAKDRDAETKERIEAACDRCGEPRAGNGDGKTYDGGAGRKLCDRCASQESAAERSPKRLVKKSTKPCTKPRARAHK